MHLPAMENESIHDIMNDDIMKRSSFMVKQAGYRHISGDFDQFHENAFSLRSGGDDIFSDQDEEEDNASTPKDRKITLLQRINGAMKIKVQRQTDQIQTLQSENIDLKKEVENYKLLLVEGANETSEHHVQMIEDTDDIKVKEVGQHKNGTRDCQH